MAKKTALERAEERIEQLQRTRSEEIQNLDKAIAKAQTDKAAAEARANKAEAAGDLATFKAEKHNIIDHETELEFFTRRRDQLQRSALVDAAEAQRVIVEILEEEDEANKADQAAIIEHMAAMETTGTRNKRRIERINGVLQAWQLDICKQPATAKSADNRLVYTFVEWALNNNFYKQIAGQPIGTAARRL